MQRETSFLESFKEKRRIGKSNFEDVPKLLMSIKISPPAFFAGQKAEITRKREQRRILFSITPQTKSTNRWLTSLFFQSHSHVTKCSAAQCQSAMKPQNMLRRTLRPARGDVHGGLIGAGGSPSVGEEEREERRRRRKRDSKKRGAAKKKRAWESEGAIAALDQGRQGYFPALAHRGKTNVFVACFSFWGAVRESLGKRSASGSISFSSD